MLRSITSPKRRDASAWFHRRYAALGAARGHSGGRLARGGALCGASVARSVGRRGAVVGRSPRGAEGGGDRGRAVGSRLTAGAPAQGGAGSLPAPVAPQRA